MNKAQNKIFTIRPYKKGSIWVFDEPLLNLKAEAFVGGATEAIDRMVELEGIKDAEKGFTLTFSANWFPDATATAAKLPDDLQSPVGTMYYWESEKMQFWLCEVLGMYFQKAPKLLYAKAAK